MVFLVIDKKCVNTIFIEEEPEIELISFDTKEEAEYYLKYGKISHKRSQHLDDPKVNNDIIKVFTDGACSKNGSVNAKAGMGIYFAKDDKRNVSRRIQGKQTNNTAELSAVIEVFTVLKDEIKQGDNIIIYTDSEYVVKCCTGYGEKCEKNDWKKKGGGMIPNVELVKEAYSLYKQYENVNLEWIKAHTNQTDELSIGNDGADRLANMSIGEEDCPYNTPINNILRDKKVYLNVPFANKEFAKKHGSKWDKDVKKWYYTEDLSNEDKDILNTTFH